MPFPESFRPLAQRSRAKGMPARKRRPRLSAARGGLPHPQPLSPSKLTGADIRWEATPAPRSRARRNCPHPRPTLPSPWERGRYPRESGARASRPGPPGPPSPPSPLSRGGGSGGAHESGEGQALPRTPGLPRRGGFPVAFQRIPPPVRSRWERRRNGIGGGPSPPPDPRVAAARPLSNGHLPLSACAGSGGDVCARGGRALSRAPGLARRGCLPGKVLPLSGGGGSGDASLGAAASGAAAP